MDKSEIAQKQKELNLIKEDKNKAHPLSIAVSQQLIDNEIARNAVKEKKTFWDAKSEIDKLINA